MCKTAPLVLCVILITLAALGNLIRFIWSVPVVIGTVHVPNWTGGVAFLILGAIAVWGFKALCPSCCGSCSTDRKDQQK